ncbi:phenylacetate-CoA oxygenase subunit PaaJ [Pelomonas sp. UHG3]|uniref:Phenylacetate-CoA oxygenase subunit PaaJ n=1 Tax=Roseateles hydrophilus TaxID=2975054 RepID=A0ACC6C6D2_9BURK|nr:1,2-phenylacetyl-CoA epoxidase subunit PaaD [Pelomonas sp. UHG3]MCY4743870.1 phenylacetate-CoA oxygenase subunit PaaJ [Pelomonas sp. UHG3]
MSLDRARAKLAAVPDPEIPAVSLVELGIVRDLRETPAGLEVVLTPTYSGCPATELIADDVRAALAEFGPVTVTLQRAPAWTTDWITPEGREKLQQYGIVPPQCSAEQAIRVVPRLRCPRCSGAQTEQLSRFGSTPCKSTWRCIECGEPFEYFKPI